MSKKESLHELTAICLEELKNKGINNEEHHKKLRAEIREIHAQDEEEYFLNLRKEIESYEPIQNENNLLIPYLLGICPDFDITKPSEYIQGEAPDLDIDFIPAVASYIKDIYLPKTYGKEYVCNICNYSTMQMKACILDVARIFGADRNEALNVTKNLDKMKDADGNELSWEQMLDINPELKAYNTKYPDICKAVRKLLKKSRSISQHAGGSIVSNVPIAHFVPLIKGKDGVPCSAWTEGQTRQDLSKFGFIKMDNLSIDTLEKVAYACELIKIRHGVKKISALDDSEETFNWSDKSYQNDPLAMEMARKGDLKTIFQLDSDGIRRLAKDVQVDSFIDVVSILSLYRPGPMKFSLHNLYAKRKNGQEQYSLHPALQPIIGETYGIMCFQEQVMKILNTIGLIPMKECVPIIKAISKKKADKFVKYKNLFIENTQQTINCSLEESTNIWNEIEAYSGYGFNKSHATAYADLSAKMMYLKAHYPIEYFTSMLKYLKTADDRMLTYMQDARSHGFKVTKVDINKSKEDFCIVDEEIYFGFSKIKGIGDEAARRIVQHQPYSSFEDFLNKFGVDANTVKPLIGLNVFNEDTPENLYKFYEAYKLKKKRVELLESRIQEYKPKHDKALQELAGNDQINCDNMEIFQDIICDPKLFKKLEGIKKKYLRLRSKAEEEAFNVDTVDFSQKAVLDEKFMEIIQNESQSQMEFYGIIWDHPMLKVEGITCNYSNSCNGFDESEEPSGILEISILDVVEKAKKVKFYSLSGEDINSNKCRIIIWGSDYNLWKEELAVGNVVRIHVDAKHPEFGNYTMSSQRYVKYIKGLNDFRVKVLGNLFHKKETSTINNDIPE